MASKAPSSPVGEPDASARPIPPDAPNGLTSGPETLEGVLAQMPGTQLVVNERVAALRATIVALSDALAEARATIAERDAQITAIRAIANTWATKRDQPHRPIPWRSVYAQFVDNINDALGQL